MPRHRAGYVDANGNDWLTVAEIKRLQAIVDAYADPAFSWTVRTVLETGIRRPGIAGLGLGHVDLQRRVVRVDHTQNASPRTVPLTAAASQVFNPPSTTPTPWRN